MAAIPVLTQLHNQVLRTSKDFRRHRTEVQAILARLTHLEPAAAQQELQKQLQQPQQPPLVEFTHRLYELMLGSGKLIPCREDSSLVIGDASLAPNSNSADGSSSSSSSSPKYFFATNLRDNSVQMPQFTLSLLQVLLRLPLGAAFVSVYESNSDDGAHGWIDVMQLALNVIGTPSRLVARGMLVRTEGQHRIEYLAQVRNMALVPLYQHYAAAAAAAATGDGSLQANSSSSQQQARQRRQRQAHPGELEASPDYIVFINDVFFCWSMVLRLMNYQADITCGLDWWQNKDATVALPQDLKQKGHQPKPAIPEEYKLEAPIQAGLGPDQTNPIVFYDIWVSRDLGGSKFWWSYPFVKDTASQPAVKKGLPFRASCCWNGLVVLAAEPFRRGLRFRSHMEGECRASECSFVCEDFARLGFTNVVVDAGVQLSYDHAMAREMLAVGIEGVGQSTWAQVLAAGGVQQKERQPAYGQMECCSLRPGAKWINYFTDCSTTDIMATNYTAQGLERGAGAGGRRMR